MGSPSLLAFLAVAALAIAPSTARGQAEIVGRVLTDSDRAPVPGAQVSISRLGRSAISDSAGRFRLPGLSSGEYEVTVRASGFRLDSALVDVDYNEVAVHDFTLSRQAQTLPGQRVTAKAQPPKGKMMPFFERQREGIGHFVTRDDLAKYEGRLRTGDVLSKVPGLEVKRGSNRAWIAGSRAVSAGGCAFCGTSHGPGGTRGTVGGLNPADFAAGARPACYMDVYLDGNLVFDATHTESGLFDVNSLQLSEIEGIEVYASAAQIPPQYNRTSNGCGVLLIWTKA